MMSELVGARICPRVTLFVSELFHNHIFWRFCVLFFVRLLNRGLELMVSVEFMGGTKHDGD